jgi:hypothetical protein
MAVEPAIVAQMMRRSVAFVEERMGRFDGHEVSDIRPTETSTVESAEGRVLSLAELSLRTPQKALGRVDYLILMMAMSHPEKAQQQAGRLIVLLPETLRSANRERQDTFLVNDLVVPDVGPFETLAILVYAVSRDPCAERLVTSLQAACGALEVTRDPLNALSLSQSIMERMEVLEASRYAEIVLAGRLSGFAAVPAHDQAPRFAALIDEGIAAAGHRQWWVRGSSLQVGDQGESVQLVGLGNYLLMRYGARTTQGGVRRYIDELRRRHALKREELRAGDQGEAYRSYVEKEVNRRRQRVIDGLYGHHTMLPVTTPIAIEAASNLQSIVLLGSNPDTEFQKQINGMREKLQAIFGVSIPGLRVRLNDTDMPQGSYLIMINEIPLVLGNIALDRCLCDEKVDRLRAMNIPAEQGVHPVDAHECGWISNEHAEAVAAAGISLWGPGDYVVLHLESILRKNLAEFMGIDELLNNLGDDAKTREAWLNRLGAAHGGVGRFRNLIVTLLNEELPVRPLPMLAHQYLEQIDRPAYEIAEDLRLLEAIHTHLIQDADQWQVYTLADDYVSLIQQHIHRDGDAVVLAMEPEPTQDALSAVRNEVGSLPPGAGRPVILVEDWRIRPFIKSLIELEFPQVKVIARREVESLSAERLKPVAVISL